MDDTEKNDTIAKVTDRLAARFPDAPRPMVAQVVGEEYESLDGSRIRTYIPTLVEHGAKNRLNGEFAAQTAAN
ncbi:three-helix bundle dimerization domain-containing protein [Arthrobacter sp. 2MCAF15]|uniref:three-helix bundle dimerization domain-containing protein n=1 Tax=Arthrobacter sp. 2MCAF15 TaxID=3232984 RepID=UPI003F93EA37